jgi:hypothetical protein
MIPAEYLDLTLRQLLALHDPKCPSGPVRVSRLMRSLRRMDAQIRANDEAQRRRERTWLAQQFQALPDK